MSLQTTGQVPLSGSQKTSEKLTELVESLMEGQFADRGRIDAIDIRLRQLETAGNASPVTVTFADAVDQECAETQSHEGRVLDDLAAKVVASAADPYDRLDAVMDLRSEVERQLADARAANEGDRKQFMMVLKMALSSTYSSEMTKAQLSAVRDAAALGAEGGYSSEAVIEAERILRRVGRGVIPPIQESE